MAIYPGSPLQEDGACNVDSLKREGRAGSAVIPKILLIVSATNRLFQARDATFT